MELKVKYEDLLLANEHVLYPALGVELKIPCQPQKGQEQQQSQETPYLSYSEDETARQNKKNRDETFLTIFDALQNIEDTGAHINEESVINDSDDYYEINDINDSGDYNEESDINQSGDYTQETNINDSGDDTDESDKIEIGDSDLKQNNKNEEESVSSFVIYNSPQLPKLPIPPELVELDHSRAVMRELEVPVYIDQYVDVVQTIGTDSEGGCSEDALNMLDDFSLINEEVISCTNYARTNPEGFQQQFGDCFREFVSPREPLQLNDLLKLSASQHSQDLAENNVISHFGSDGSTVAERVDRTGYQFSLVGENVLYNRFYNASALDLVGQWWCSEGHYQNMVGCRYSEIGMSVVIGSTGYFATQHLGCPQQQEDCNSC